MSSPALPAGPSPTCEPQSRRAHAHSQKGASCWVHTVPKLAYTHNNIMPRGKGRRHKHATITLHHAALCRRLASNLLVTLSETTHTIACPGGVRLNLRAGHNGREWTEGWA